jgi:hypothetical protein
MREEAGVRHEVDRASRLVVRARSIQADLITGPAEREVDPIRPGLGAPIAVEVVVKRPLAPGHQPEERLTRPRPRPGDALVERGGRGRRAVAREQLPQARFGQVTRCHHRPRVALDETGQATVRQEDAVGLLVQLPLAHDPHRRHLYALVEDLGGVGRDAAGAEPTDVLVVPERRGERDRLALVKDGHDEVSQGSVTMTLPPGVVIF